ncbi:hypothetical protein CR51_27345 [Caballeronia megalochromosomata]|nr:hypothetical protein CR51_27345 [Caballeronia megalochromosomata]
MNEEQEPRVLTRQRAWREVHERDEPATNGRAVGLWIAMRLQGRITHPSESSPGEEPQAFNGVPVAPLPFGGKELRTFATIHGTPRS